MSNQLAVIDLNSASNLPAYLREFQTTTGKNLIVGGIQRNRIGLKGSRFRLIVNGQEEGVVDDNFLDVVIVGAAEGVARIYYADGYNPEVKQPPTCYSRTGVEPAADVHNKQSTKCATCPQNEKGSKISDAGLKTRACGFFKRLAVVLPSEPTRVYQLDGKSMTVFGESKPTNNKFSLKEYGTKLATRGIDPSMVVTRLSFDTDSSVPKVLFTPTRFLEPDEATIIQEVINGEDTKGILEITAQTVDISGEVAAEEAPVPEAAPAPAPAPEPAKPAAPTITRTAPAVSKPAVSAPSAAAAPVVTRAAGPAVVRAAAPSVAAPKVTQAAAPTAAPAAANPPIASSDDDDLAKILADLDAE